MKKLAHCYNALILLTTTVITIQQKKMKLCFHGVSWSLLLALLLLPDLAAATSSQDQYSNQQRQPVACQPEFQSCYFRNCCNDLVCFTPTTTTTTTPMMSDHNPLEHTNMTSTSTCYSERSVDLMQTSYDEKLQLLQDFYQDLVPLSSTKSMEQIQRMMTAHHHDFARLVSRLENRYQISFSTLLDKNKNNNNNNKQWNKIMTQDL
jgi:hypothetical protein